MPIAMTILLSSYDQWNNSPPGAGIEYARNYGYPTIHNLAGGTGTYANPITFGAPPHWLKPGTRIYIPEFRKYFILEDLCSSCTLGPQADIWVQGVTRAQERNLSPSNIVNLWERDKVIVYPVRNLPVRTTPLRQVSS